MTGNYASRTPLAGWGSGRIEGFNPESFVDAFARKAGDDSIQYRLHPNDDELTTAFVSDTSTKGKAVTGRSNYPLPSMLKLSIVSR